MRRQSNRRGKAVRPAADFSSLFGGHAIMANPLTLILPIQDGQLPALIKALAGQQQNIGQALIDLGIVHYARSVIIDASARNLQPSLPFTGGPYSIAIITEYDGDFNSYIQEFVDKIGDAFNIVLKYVVGGSAVLPVQQNLAAFQAFLAANDMSQQKNVPNGELFSAYPQTVQKILGAFPPSLAAAG
jgi:hypothetical protein